MPNNKKASRIRDQRLADQDFWQDGKRDERDRHQDTAQQDQADFAAHAGRAGIAVAIKEQAHYNQQVEGKKQPC